MTAVDIRRPEAVDPAWMTRALQGSGIDAVVREITSRPVGTGQIGDTVRFAMTYERGGDAAPATVVGKFPAADPKSFAAGVSGGNYVREVMFYRKLATTAAIATPDCYLAEVDQATGAFVLLLEDLAPAQQGDQIAGISLDQAHLAIDEAAKLHASHWGDDALEDEPWLTGSRAATGTSPLSPVNMMNSWAGFRDRYGDQLGADTIEAARRLAERMSVLREMTGSRCVIHQDFRPDNMMFASSEGGRPITVVDWQSAGLGAGPNDLGYFLAGSLPAALRRRHEAAFLQRYHAGLLAGGVADYDMADLRRDYAVGGLRLLMIAFVSSQRVKQTERGDAMFMQMARSAMAHIVDNEALALLD